MSYINAFDELCFWADVYRDDAIAPNEKQRPLVESMTWANDLIESAIYTPIVDCSFRDELVEEIDGGLVDIPITLWEAIVYTCNDSAKVVAKFYPKYAPIIEQMDKVFDLV